MAATQQKQDYGVAVSNLATDYAALVVAGDNLAEAQENLTAMAAAYQTAKSNFDGRVQELGSAASALTGEYDTYLPNP